MQAPYTPVVNVIQHTTWEVNDPLVHYLASDLAPHTETPIASLIGVQSVSTRLRPAISRGDCLRQAT